MKLIELLAQPQKGVALKLKVWSQIIREARYHNMLAQLYFLYQHNQLAQQLPSVIQATLRSSKYPYDNQKQQLGYEAEKLASQLSQINVSPVFLKGSAYQLLEISSFKGRIMADIDLLIPQEQLVRSEELLLKQGWVPKQVSNYDDKFYREWSQEIPPMRHSQTGIELDVHFNIFPIILKSSPSPEKLLAHAQPIDKCPGARSLTPAAMAYHSAIHLFFESEFHKGLRDLYDLKLLFEQFGCDTFWEDFIQLDKELPHGGCIFLALTYTSSLLGTAIPESVLSHYSKYKLPTLFQKLVDRSFEELFTSYYPEHRSWFHKIAKNLLFWRGHLKRMPAHRLLLHLSSKFFKNLSSKEDSLEELFP